METKVPKPKAAKSKGGRPTVFTRALAAEICEMVAEGMSMKEIYMLPDMPRRSTVYGWLSSDKEFSDLYARAQEERAELLADEIISIADNGDLDPNDRKVRLDARKWIASKLKPGKYGDKVAVSGDAANPVVHSVIFEVVRAKNPNG
jgi:hypothetical protein